MEGSCPPKIQPKLTISRTVTGSHTWLSMLQKNACRDTSVSDAFLPYPCKALLKTIPRSGQEGAGRQRPPGRAPPGGRDCGGRRGRDPGGRSVAPRSSRSRPSVGTSRGPRDRRRQALGERRHGAHGHGGVLPGPQGLEPGRGAQPLRSLLQGALPHAARLLRAGLAAARELPILLRRGLRGPQHPPAGTHLASGSRACNEADSPRPGDRAEPRARVPQCRESARVPSAPARSVRSGAPRAMLPGCWAKKGCERF